MLMGVMMAVAMLLMLVAEVVARALGGSRYGRQSNGRDKKGGSEQGSQHWLSEFRETLFEREGAQRKLTSPCFMSADHIPL